MKSLEHKIVDAIKAGKEFEFLDDYKKEFLGIRLDLTEINYVLDLYNYYYKGEEDPNFAKQRSMMGYLHYLHEQLDDGS